MEACCEPALAEWGFVTFLELYHRGLHRKHVLLGACCGLPGTLP